MPLSTYDNQDDKTEVYICLDMNLNSLDGKWLRPSYKLYSLAKMVQNYCDTGNLSQLVEGPTRMMYNSVSKLQNYLVLIMCTQMQVISVQILQ